MDADGKDEKSTTFRWINVVRYAVATMMTVLMTTVVVIAIKTVMRPDTLFAFVVGGSISVESQPGLPPNQQQLQLVFNLQTNNPSGRAVMYYYNITCYLFDKNMSASTAHPVADSITWFEIANITVLQQKQINSITRTPMDLEYVTASYFDMLHNNRSATIDVTMRMEGFLVTEPISGWNTTARWTTYYCSPLVVSWAPNTTRGGEDGGSVLCNTVMSR